MQREPTAVTRTLQMLSFAVAVAGAFFSPAVAVKRVTPKEIWIAESSQPRGVLMVALTKSVSKKTHMSASNYFFFFLTGTGAATITNYYCY